MKHNALWFVEKKNADVSLYTEWANNKALMHSSEDTSQYPETNHSMEEHLKMHICMCTHIYTHTDIHRYMNHFAIQQ